MSITYAILLKPMAEDVEKHLFSLLKTMPPDHPDRVFLEQELSRVHAYQQVKSVEPQRLLQSLIGDKASYFSNKAQEAIAKAISEATARGHEAVGKSHLLLGIISTLTESEIYIKDLLYNNGATSQSIAKFLNFFYGRTSPTLIGVTKTVDDTLKHTLQRLTPGEYVTTLDLLRSLLRTPSSPNEKYGYNVLNGESIGEDIE